MKKFIIGLMTGCSLMAAPPAYAQSSAPASSVAPGANDDQCEDNSYVPVYEVANDGKSDSLAEAGTGETNADALAKQTTPAPSVGTPSTPSPQATPTNFTGTVSVPGSNRTVGGQPVKVKSNSVNTSTLTPQMKSILDNIYGVAKQMGMPTPVITSADDSDHKKGSKHYSGNGIDLRCNTAFASAAKCQAYANALARSLGFKYDVIFEVFPNNPANNHIHIEYDPN